MIGSSDRHGVLTLVDRKTGYVLIGKLRDRTVNETNRRALSLLRKARRRTLTLTPDRVPRGWEYLSDRGVLLGGLSHARMTPHRGSGRTIRSSTSRI
jgi:hypothetical protein